MKYLIKYCWKVSFLLLLLFSLACTNTHNLKAEPKKHIENEIGAEEQLISKIENKIIDEEQSKMPSFYFRFDFDDDILEKNTETPYEYYLLKNKSVSQIKSTFSIENTLVDTTISLFILQGREIVKVRLADEKEWNKVLNIDTKKDTLTQLNIEIEWNVFGSEELLIFPYVNGLGDFYSGGNVTLMRFFVANSPVVTNVEEKIADLMLYDDTKAELNIIPTLSFVDDKKNKIPHEIINNQAYFTESIDGLEISPLSYTTKVDVVYINTHGENKILEENLMINSNVHTYIDITSLPSVSKGNEFIFVVNNKERDMVYNYYAVKSNLIKASNNFNQIIEIYKHQDDILKKGL